MTPEHEAFIQYLSGSDRCFVADVLRKHWTKGKRYYIDSRVDISGHRREFNRLNKMMGE